MENRSKKKRLDDNSFLLAVTIILFFVMYITGIIVLGDRGSARVQNFLSLFIPSAGLIVVATGMTVVMITGGIGISVDSVMAMVYIALAWTMERGSIGALPVILIMLITGRIFGLVQGLLVTYLKMQPLIVILAGVFFVRNTTSTISQEMVNIANKTSTGIVIFRMYLPSGGYLNRKGVTIYLYVYPNVIITLAVLAIVLVVFKYTKFGRSICAVGGNEQSALLLSLNVRRIEPQACVLDGFLAGPGGPLSCMNTCSSFMGQVKGFKMDAIASSVIGGTFLTGDVRNIVESLFEVLTKGTIGFFITSQGTFSSWWVKTTIATFLCLLIVLQSLITALKRKNK